MDLKGALHVHTTCSDGEQTVREVLEVYEGLGYDFVALTDHDYLMNPDCYDTVYQADTGMIVFTGTELTVFERGYCHVNRINGNHDTLYVFNHPGQYEWPVPEVVRRMRAIAERLPLDAVEITTNGYFTPEYAIPEIPYPKVATDDSHCRRMCGRAWVELDCPRDKDAIIRAIRNGDFRNRYNE